MNIPLLVAGVLAALAALVHTIGGEITTIRPLAAAELHATPRLELRAVWYMFAVHLTASALALFVLAFAAASDVTAWVGRFVAAQFLGYGLALLGLAVVQRAGLFRAPQWVVLLLIAGLAYWGTL